MTVAVEGILLPVQEEDDPPAAVAAGAYDAHKHSLEYRDFDSAELALLRATFHRWDTKGDGCVSLKELQEVLVALGSTKAEVKKIFAHADRNRDGVLDHSEFVAWLGGHLGVAGSVPAGVLEKALSPMHAVAVEELSWQLSGDKSYDWWTDNLCPFVRWRDSDVSRVLCQSPEGSGLQATLKLTEPQQRQLVFEIPDDHRGAVNVEIWIARTIRGDKLVATGVLLLRDVIRELSQGIGRGTLRVAMYAEGAKGNANSFSNTEMIGHVDMTLKEATPHDEGWAKLMVRSWQTDGLPPLPSFADTHAALVALASSPQQELEATVMDQIESHALQQVSSFGSCDLALASAQLNALEQWLWKLTGVCADNAPAMSVSRGRGGGRGRGGPRQRHRRMEAYGSRARLEALRLRVTAQVLGAALREQELSQLKVALRFARALQCTESPEYAEAVLALKRISRLPDNTDVDRLLTFSEADCLQRDPREYGLILAEDGGELPSVDDKVRFGVRDATAERVLHLLLGHAVKLHFSRGITYERLAVEAISSPSFVLNRQVQKLLEHLVVFRGSPTADRLSIGEAVAARERNWEALLGRFDVVAQPVRAEYDRHFRALCGASCGLSPFFGEDLDAPIGGTGWFWVLHAAAVNIGESTSAEDFLEYSVPSPPAAGARAVEARQLDEDRYSADMATLWQQGLRAARHLGVEDIVLFPFGMGAFLRNLHHLDARYADETVMRRLRLRIAAGLFDAAVAEAAEASAQAPLRLHLCLVDCSLESRVNHNVFVEAAATKAKVAPELTERVLFYRNVDALELAHRLASSDAGSSGASSDTVRKVALLNGANNKLLGNHWFAHGARTAIDENLHRRCGAMCVGSLLLNMATSPQCRNYQELATNAELLGGRVVDLLPS